jgi:hypothetical protein
LCNSVPYQRMSMSMNVLGAKPVPRWEDCSRRYHLPCHPISIVSRHTNPR